MPVAPGTVASLPVAVAAWLAGPSPLALGVAALVVAAVGVWASGREERRLGTPDPSSVVVDEVAGMLVALVGHPATPGRLLLLFLLFRLFDVWKPFPVARLQRLPGGYGIVADDLAAGLAANLVGRGVGRLWS